ncbi:MAG: cyclophilin-like fold protein [Clostridiaceae bacterium]
MKKFLPIFFAFAVIFTFAGCSNTAANNRNASSETSADLKDNSTNEHDKIPKDSEKENTIVEKMISMNITVGSSTFTATLEDNDTAKTFVKQLPLTVDMSELNGNEKYNYLASDLRADTSSCPGRINEGDLMLYGNNCLVLFYKTLNTSYNYVKLGRIDNTKGLTEAVGSGNVKVTFSASK